MQRIFLSIVTILMLTTCGALAQETKGAGFINIDELQTVTRFNYMDHGPSEITDRDIQYRIRFRPQINFVPSGNTYLKLRAETGKGFDNSWDNTGIGLGEKAWDFNVKTITLGQKFGDHTALEAGGLEFEQAAGSQKTYASGDSYFVGYRFVYTGEQVNKVSLTAGFIGDFDQQNVFKRLHLGKINYLQGLVQKKFGQDVEASAQYSSIQDVHFLGQALQWKKVPGKVVQNVALELIERVSDNAQCGLAAIAGRSLDAAGLWQGQLIYSDIPLNLYVKNGATILQDQGEIDHGKRLSGGLKRKIGNSWEFGFFGGRRLDETPGKRWVAQIFVSHDFAGLLNRVLHN